MKNITVRSSVVLSCFLLLASCLISCGRTSTSTPASITKLESKSGDNYKIGVILPLSGKYKIYGESALHGIECAAGVYSPCNGIIKATLVIKDDKGMPDIAAMAVEELVDKEKVGVIIGPLSSASVEAAAAKAQELGVPLISLSQKEGVTQMGEYIFSVAMTARSQIEMIVDWAVNKKKMKTFAVIYPLSTYGEASKRLFNEAVKKAGGRVVLSEGYGETNLDFSGIFGKGVKFDALFIPDSYRAVGYLSSAMMLEGIEGVQLLGNNRWNSADIAERGGEAVQGAVFVDGFSGASHSAAVQNFISVFDQVYKLKPTILESQGYDATMLASKALQATGGAHGKDVRDSLAAIPDIEGSTGSTGFDQNREVIRRMFVLTVKGDNIKELEGTYTPPPPRGKYGEPIQTPSMNR
ncbi:MAG: hypothetical protein COV46_07985 [Deltaproteobacteria bacterium CG11_big_fil_rev_8_21_14_0_20_49_13]|nr:MAG: hypothetical protein COV46_07985 [Deltaproteobacteria bacterium CG11_big_fil_rev_8_21_14_0_20_49_13]